MKTEREAFEEWAKANGYHVAKNPIGEGYLSLNCNSAWSVWQAAKASAIQNGRTDFEIIEQTIAIVDLLASSNRFQRDKSKPFPFESENPRNMEWWRIACEIQELLTNTDPNNCDFEEYKAMIEAARE